jgi:hypothetical protein
MDCLTAFLIGHPRSVKFEFYLLSCLVLTFSSHN